jgi:hypothetical protein
MSFREGSYEKYTKEKEMSLTLKKSDGADFELIPAGTHAAICIKLIDFGPQTVEYNGEFKEQNKVRLMFEVPAERVEWTDKEGVDHEGPMTVGKTYTASMFAQATLRQHLESWRGKNFSEVEEMGFDIRNVLGKPCMLGVQHKEYQNKGYAAITSISPLMKGMEIKAENDLMAFDFDDHTQAELDALPGWAKEKVEAGKQLLATQKERTRAVAEKELANMNQTVHAEDKPATDGFEDSDIPF